MWSTDWVRDPERQIKRIMLAYEEELRGIHNGEASNADSVPPDELATAQEERPVLRIRDPQEGAAELGYYSNIDQVPNQVLQQAICELLRRFGQTSREELFRTVAHKLGFQRTGNRIQERIGCAIDEMAVRGEVTKNSDGFLSVG